MGSVEGVPRPNRHAVEVRVDLHDVERERRGEAETLPLTDGESVHALVTAEHASAKIADHACLPQRGRPALDEPHVVSICDKADLVAVRLVRHGEAETACARTDVRLVEPAEGKHRVREL